MLEAIRQEIEEAIGRYCQEPGLREAVLRALTRRGFALHPEAPCRAGLLTGTVYAAIRGAPGPAAFLGAAAVELQIEASFMLDHVADGELEPSERQSPGEELALAIALLTCGAATACEAVQEAGTGSAGLQALVEFHRSGISACGGQFLDVTMERREPVTSDEALRMTALKAGSLGRLAAAFGASLATDDREAIALFAELGANLFTYLQLLDDLRDACPVGLAPKDLARHKKTVPLVFFYEFLAQGSPQACRGIIGSTKQGECPAEVRREYGASRAELFGAIVAETFLNRARSNLERLKGRLVQVGGLERLVEDLEFDPKDILVPA